MVSLERAQRVAAAWIEAWNRHDLPAILAHYADSIVFTSPLVVERLGRVDGTIRDKQELERYFAMGVGAGSTLAFELMDVVPGVDSIVLYYRNHRGRRVAELMVLDADDRAVRVMVHYV